MILVQKRKGCKIVINGPDANGKNTSRSILVSDCDVDQIVVVIEKAIRAETLRQALEENK